MCQNTLIDSLLNFHRLYNFNAKGEFCKEKKCREKMKVGLFVTCLVDLMRPNIGFSSDVTREAHESALKPRSAWLSTGTS